jgi:polysaccharide deacetylase family protein (PEP-CTERM system associated)
MPSNQQPASSNQIRATFFVLGWIAERLPHLVREIHARGHEVASHGYYHNLCNQQSPDALKKDLTDSKKLLEDIVSAPISGYRAPSFSIDKDILKIIKDCGYLYDSSYNSFSMHGRYGRLNLSQNARKGIALQIPAGHKSPPSTHYQQPASSNEQRATINQHPVTSIEYQSSIFNLQSSILFELPISNLKLGNHIIPWGGGAYFRLIPSSILFTGVKAILRKHNAYLLYLHPWELDPQQPKVKDAGTFHRVRHYTNLDKTHSKLFRLVQSFEHCNFVTCSQYLSTISQELSPMSYEL